MEVNKKQLADIFGASIRTIQNWQEQGMPVLRGGGKGNEVLYDSAAVIKWYAERDAEIENEKLRREVEELRQASEADLQPGTIEYERHRLTRAQADAQELKNARDSAEVVETAFCTFVLSRIAGEIASILDGIGKTHLAQELWTQIDNGQLAPDLAEIRTSITDVSNEITQTVNKKLEDQSAAIQQIQKVQVDTNNNLNSMWAVKLQQMQDGRLYIAGIGAGIENTPDGMQSQVLLAADRIAMVNPANGNTKPMFVGQGDQIFMNDVFLKYLTAPTITSGGNPPAFSLTPDGKLTAKNADISGSVNANSGTLNNVTINENCQIKGKLSANQIEGDIVKTVGKAFPQDSRAPERWPSGTITVRIYDDQPFDRQIVIPAVAFCGAKHERENNDIYSSCRLIVKKNGAEIYNRTALDNTLIYSGVIDMPAGHGHMTLEFSVSAWLVNDWYPTASISDLLVVVMKKATAGISIS
ncbi:DUF1983 domain-containing protein [Escherichia coli O106]|nr:DUF1983 domain-containing protein [Escherichia coli O106]EQY62464.1 terminase small subunit [Escherichia coli UMEA 3240-1]TGH41484.1 DUF1983 domain-containing protein [Escherichia coli]